MVDKEQVRNELAKVVDPEIGMPITEMNLIDEIDINEKSEVTVKYHLTMPFCPPVFALAIGQDIKKRVSSLEGVTKVTAILSNHQMADEINKRINS
jgi:ATP-binding protein involved in chromosome partitioning